MHLEQPEVDANGHVRTRTHSLKVKIPIGISPGQKIRLTGQGGRGSAGGADGDLFLEVEFKPHKLYRVEDRDIYLDLPITPWEAALGARVEVPTLAGKVGMKIPEGARSGQKLRLKGRGLAGNNPGDQYVVLQIMTPPAQTNGQRKLYEKMAKEMPFNPREGMES